MKLIIDIPEEVKHKVYAYGLSLSPSDKEQLIKAIINGTPLEQTGQFAKWVATEIFDEMWEYNKDAFAEIACRKLAKLGIVREKGDEWELVEPKESEKINCKTVKCENCINHNYCDYEPQESEDKE